MINIDALIGTGIVLLAALVIRSAYRRYQAARQQRYDRAYAAGYAAGEARQGRLGYAQGHEDGLAEGRAQAGRELTISTEKAYSRGYECGQLDLLSTLEQADQARGTGPTMSA